MSRVSSAEGARPRTEDASRTRGPSGGGPDRAHPHADDTLLDPPRDGVPAARPSRWVPMVSYAATVLILVTLNFAVPRLMPGDPIAALMAQSSPNYVQDEATRANLAEYYHLDEPLPAQYASYLSGLVRGDLGHSIYSNRPVSQELRERLGWTFLLLVVSMLLAIGIGLPAGVHSAWKRGRRVDSGLLGFFLTAQNVPIYFVGSVALLLLSVQLGLFPLGGASTPFAEHGLVGSVLDVAHHLALPALLMAVEFSAFQYLVMRSSMVSELGADYLLGGRAKGVQDRRLKYRYAGRNALLPVVTVIGMQFSLAVTSTIFVEQIFSYPGVGLYMFSAVGVRDYPAIQGAFLVLTISVLTVNLLVDLLYRRLDPRTAS